MNKSYLLIGGNEGDRIESITHAREDIVSAGIRILHSSSLYETAPWGKTDQDDFINQALSVETTLAAQPLMTVLLNIEERMGRRRMGRWGPRIIDIDILFFGDELYDRPGLTIPHPEIQNRRFALVPMEEIAPHFIHPVLRRSIRQLLAECPDRGDVKKITAII